MHLNNKLLLKIRKFCLKICNKVRKIKTNITYESLKPKDDINIESLEALDYAFKNKKIKNIAITGNYSSGKSSVIESYIVKRKIRQNKINKISLATFDESESKIDAMDIEKYIIEQLYYSSYKKIIKNNTIKSWILSYDLYLIVLSIISLFNFTKIVKLVLIKSLCFKIIIGCLFFIISLFLIWILKNILKYIYKIDSFSLQIMDFSIEVKQDDKTSVINQNMELLLKIFSKLNYKYIFFEDIDRFNKPIIFEHLRELNNILNKNQNVKFIYLLRDDVFKGENRTKFFDFIYPVVPFISYSSSGEELYKLIVKYKLQRKLPQDFILNITIFVQDMRILCNTLNEYRIYDKDLNNNGIDSKNLFAILLYKNVFPDDFSKLQLQQGMLYDLITKKEKIIQELMQDINNKIIERKKELESINTQTYDEEIFCRAAEKIILQNNEYRTSIEIKNDELGNKKLDRTTELNYEYLTDENTIIPYDDGKADALTFYENFAPKLYEMVQKIEANKENHKKEIENSIDILIAKLEETKSYTIETLVKENLIDEEEFNKFDNSNNKTGIENIKTVELVKFLLQEGYINEYYSRYIEKFHSGSISKKDNDFLGNCIINKTNDFLQELDNPNKIISRLKESDFNEEAVLNISIFKSILFKPGIKLNNYINTFLKSESFEIYLTLCETLMDDEQLDKMYCEIMKNIYVFKYINSIKDKELKKKAVEKILLSSNIEDIKEILDFEELKKFIEDSSILLSSGINNYDTNIVVKIIEELDIKYSDIDNNNLRREIYKYCVENGNYKININNIKSVLKYVLGINTSSFLYNTILTNNLINMSYSVIITNENVYNYIKENINNYLDNVYFKQSAHQNNEESIRDLLNDSNISDEKKEKIIELEATSKENENRKGIIKELIRIENTKLYNKILERDLVEVSFDSIYVYFSRKINIYEDESDETADEGLESDIQISKEILVDFINRNAKTLEKEKCDFIDQKELLLFLASQNDINNDTFEMLINKFDSKIDDIELNEISNDKIEILAKNNILAFNDKIYETIREKGGKALVYYTHFNRFNILNNLKHYRYNSSEIVQIINANGTLIHYTFKQSILKNLVNYETFNFNAKNANKIVEYIINKKIEISFSSQQLIKLINCCDNSVIIIKFINFYFKKFNKELIKDILENKLTTYLPLIKNRNKPSYKNILYNRNFIDNLKSLGYNIKYEIKDNTIYIKPTKR